MNTRHASSWFWPALAAVFLCVLFVASDATTQSQTPAQQPDVKTAGGLTTVTFYLEHGELTVNLPDDIRAGDTVSGTVVAEPKGQTTEERAKNRSVLNGLVIEIDGKRVEPFAATPKERESVIQQTFWIYTAALAKSADKYKPGDEPAKPVPISVADRDGKDLAQATILIWQMFDEIRKVAEGMTPSGAVITPDPKITPPTHPSGAIITPDPKITPPTHPSGAIITPDPKITPPTHPSGAIITPDPKITPPTHPSGAIITPDPKITPPTHPSGAVITPDPKITNPPFAFPLMGQTGRPIVVTGPFDGNSSNTTVRVGDWEDRETTGRLDVIAESPRKAVVNAPTNVTGPIKLRLTEGNTQSTGSYRNVGVVLTAPKTNLLKGEQTELRVEVNGLQGIKEPVPLTLESFGVIRMEGGIYQPLVIQPSQVNADGRYSTTRGITGVQTGGWEATATVVTHRFDVCLQDDSAPDRRVLWNTFTGDYIFTNIFPPPAKPRDGTVDGGTVQTGGTQTGDTGAAKPTDVVTPNPPGGLTGTGKIARKGCILTLTHNAPDRRVMSRLDGCNKTGDASVQTTSPKTNLTITDKNITDNTLPSK